MKDKLEQFIIKNRESFDIHEPSEFVWNKVQKQSKKPKKVFINYKIVLTRVAALIIVFIGSYFFHSYMYNRSNNNKLALKDRFVNEIIEIPELVETETYYNSMVSTKLNELKVYTSGNPEIENDVKYDLNELDSVYAEIKQDLKDNVANDEVIEALIQNYRLKLKILEDLLDQLKQSQNQNKNENEIHEL